MIASNSPMQGKVCLVTGATSGIGLVTARELARQGAGVVLVGRDPARCTPPSPAIKDQTGNSQIESLLADLSSQQQVRELARQFRERCPRLDVLINNAGGIWMNRQVTVDGLEMTVAVNHLAPFLLTHLLLDLLKAGASVSGRQRSSRPHQRATLDFDDLMAERNYGGWRQYCRSKLMNLLFTYELSRHLDGTAVTANALHPGWVATGFAANNGWKGRLMRLTAGLFAIGPEEGARTVVYLASSPEVTAVSGRYFVREHAVPSSPASYDEAAQQRLWQWSLDMTGLPSSPN